MVRDFIERIKRLSWYAALAKTMVVHRAECVKLSLILLEREPDHKDCN